MNPSECGKRVKALRLFRGMTQKELAGGQITRNMLSQIERGVCLPSYQTVVMLSDRLHIDPGYFFDNSPDYPYYDFQAALPKIRRSYTDGRYDECLRLLAHFSAVDHPAYRYYLLASRFQKALEDFKALRFQEARESFAACKEAHTGFGIAEGFLAQIPFYERMIDSYESETPVAPLKLLQSMPVGDEPFDFMFYSFLMSLMDAGQSEKAAAFYNTVGLKSELYKSHFNARLAASMNNYSRAKQLLWEIVNEKEAPLPFLYRVFDDLERFCKATEDYEGAYRCALAKQRLRKS